MNHSSDDNLGWIVTLLIVCCALFILHWHVGRARLKRWSLDQGFDLVKFRGAWGKTPFNETYVVYYVTVRDLGGHTKTGTVACGGLFCSDVHVLWD